MKHELFFVAQNFLDAQLRKGNKLNEHAKLGSIHPRVPGVPPRQKVNSMHVISVLVKLFWLGGQGLRL